MMNVLKLLQKNLVWAIPASMALGLAFGYFFDAAPLKQAIIPVTFIMVYPMMVNLNIQKVFEGGDLMVAAQTLSKGTGASLGPGHVALKNGPKTARFLWLQGKPIDEPVAKYGPFVMNQPEEINKAMEEYRLTQFGGWPWRHPDHAHPREKGRFAHYPDGHLEEKG